MTPAKRQDSPRCAVCDRVIRPGLLMCPPHWSLTPAALQLAVLRTFGRWRRHAGTAAEALALIRDYCAARAQAVAAVEDALNATDLTGESNE